MVVWVLHQEGTHMRILAAILAVTVSPLALTQGLAADIDIASHIDAVTVYPDGAMVTRLAELAVPAGASSLIVKGLPAVIDPASIRVEARMDNALAIGSVEMRLSPADPSATINPELEAKIAVLREESDRVSARIEALEVKQKTITRYSELDPTKLARRNSPEDASSWKLTWDTIGEELARVNEELRVEHAKADELEKRMAALQKAQGPASGDEPGRDIVIAVEADGAAKGSLAFSYRVTQAGWMPRYEARFESAKEGKSSLELVRRATIIQRTGEDWENAAVSVSTTHTLGGTAAPQLAPLTVAIIEPPPPASAAAKVGKLTGGVVSSTSDSYAHNGISYDLPTRKGPPVSDVAGNLRNDQGNGWAVQGGTGVQAPMSGDGEGAWGSAQYSAGFKATLAVEDVPAQPRMAVLDAGPYQASFKVPGRVSVPRDGSQKTFTLSTASFAPELLARVTPAVDQTAYLEASFVETEEAPLLPGEVSITRDGVYVGKGRFPLVAPGDKAVLGLGADDRVKVVRVPLRQEDNAPSWIGNTRSRVAEFKTSIRNLHPARVKVAVLDRMPVAENDRVSVEALQTNTAPSETSVADQRGVSGWSFELPPGEQKDIRFGWRLSWPADREIRVGGNAPIQAYHFSGGSKF